MLVRDSGSTSISQDVSQLLEQAEKGQISLEHLLIATEKSKHRGREIAASILMIVQPDRSGLLWCPAFDKKLSERERELSGRLLLDEIAKKAIRSDCMLLQICLPEISDQHLRIKLLKETGFEELGKLWFMIRSSHCQRPASVESGEAEIQLNPCTKSLSEKDLRELLGETYEDSCDFPELEDCRDAKLSLKGHRAQGRYRPDWWDVIEWKSQPVGLLIFAEHPDLDQVELVYLGLAKKFRGKGIGKAALRKALNRFDRRSQSTFLGVDSRNVSAVRLYERMGYSRLSSQRLFVRRLDEGGD